jgi:hypothetical protein
LISDKQTMTGSIWVHRPASGCGRHQHRPRSPHVLFGSGEWPLLSTGPGPHQRCLSWELEVVGRCCKMNLTSFNQPKQWETVLRIGLPLFFPRKWQFQSGKLWFSLDKLTKKVTGCHGILGGFQTWSIHNFDGWSSFSLSKNIDIFFATRPCLFHLLATPAGCTSRGFSW